MNMPQARLQLRTGIVLIWLAVILDHLAMKCRRVAYTLAS